MSAVTHPVVIVGAGPTGLTLAIDLAQRGVRVVLIDGDARRAAGLPSAGSKAICFAKRTLEVWDKLGGNLGQRMVDKGVPWNVGRVFLQDDEVYSFNLSDAKSVLAEPALATSNQRPAFINLQQYYAEEFLMDRAKEFATGDSPFIDIRLGQTVKSIKQVALQATLDVTSKTGDYEINARYVVACDGSKSTIKRSMGLGSQGRTFQDRFLIADVRMTADFPTERWFWFDPPFHPNQSVLLHRQPDNVWRIDFQLGWDADPEEEKKPERIKPRIMEMLSKAFPDKDGMKTEFELVWASVYTFACSRMEKFVHDRVIFAGDAAHGVSPFGARGANSGVQDAENLAWKLALVLSPSFPRRRESTLLASYGQEREYAADDNIKQSTRSTDFITPKSEISHVLRRAVLDLARQHPFARSLVNSGRLSTATYLPTSPLHTEDEAGDVFPSTAVRVGSVMHSESQVDAQVVQKDDVTYLIRPDGHVAARWLHPTELLVQAARAKAFGGMAC